MAQVSPKGWEDFFKQVAPELELINNILSKFKAENIVYPKEDKDIFKIFTDIKPEDVKVVILGNHPTENVINYAFASREVNYGPIQKLFQKVQIDTKVPPKVLDNTLSCWVKQGVMLLNTALTCFTNQKKSHKGLWLGFIGKFMEYIEQINPNVIIVCMGADLVKYECPRSLFKISCSAPGTKGWRDLKSFDEVEIFNVINSKLEKPIEW